MRDAPLHSALTLGVAAVSRRSQVVGYHPPQLVTVVDLDDDERLQFAPVTEGDRPIHSLPPSARRTVLSVQESTVGFPETSNARATEDEAEFLSIRDAITRFIGPPANQITPARGSLEETHLDNLGKWIKEDGGPPFWWARLNKVRKEVAPFSTPLLTHMRDMLSCAPSTPPFKEKIPRGTNHGYPTWRSDDIDLAAHVQLGWAIEEDNALLDEAVEHFVADSTLEPCMTLLSRTGPIGKWQPLYGVEGGRPVLLGKTRGVFCRRRDVNGVPTWMNFCAWRDVMKLTTVMKANPLFGHKDQAERQAKFRALSASHFLISDDGSAFDDSVTAGQLRAFVSACPSWMRGIRLLDDMLRELPLLSPPLGAGEARYVPTRGTMASGAIYTSVGDTAINWWVVMECLAAGLRLRPAELVRRAERGDVLVFCQGDDSLIALWKGARLDEARYSARGAELGHSRKISGLPVFLQAYLDPKTGLLNNLAARALMRTTARERAASHELVEVLGWCLRWSLAARARDALRLYEPLRSLAFARRHGLTTLQDAVQKLADPVFTRAVNEVLLQSNSGDVRELTRALEDMPPGLVAADTLEAIEGRGYIRPAELVAGLKPGAWRDILIQERKLDDGKSYQ